MKSLVLLSEKLTLFFNDEQIFISPEMEATKRTRNPVTQEVKEAIMQYFDTHREDIRYAYKGYLKKVKAAFETESGYTLTDCQFRKLLEVFRLTHNCPIEYVPNKYYKPARHYYMSNYVKTEKADEASDEKNDEHSEK